MFIFYPFLALGSFLIAVLSVVLLNWIVVLFVKVDRNLPRWLSYFQTFDAPLPIVFQDGSVLTIPFLGATISGILTRYFAAALWLMRNPTYGWDYFFFGMTWQPIAWKVKYFNSTPTRDIFFATSVTGGFNFYYLGPRGMYKFGWKAWNCFNQETGEFTTVFGDGTHTPICFSLNPFKTKMSSA